MIRLTLLWMVVAAMAAYSSKDWYKSLCGLILLLAVVEHPDFPKSLFGVQGLNPWNVLLMVVVAAWANGRKKEKLQWDMPKPVSWLLIIYFSIVVLSLFRFIFSPDGWVEYVEIRQESYPGVFSLLSEYVINCLKWVVPGILLYDGCRSEQRLRLATYTILGIYILFAIQVIRWVPLGYLANGTELQERALKIISNEIGFHRVNMSMMLAGASWAIYCMRDWARSHLEKNVMLGLSALSFFGMALTGGRMGYVTWAVLGLIFAALRWRKLFLLGPAVLTMFVLLVPQVQDRFVAGFSPDTVDVNNRLIEAGYQGAEGPDLYTVTSGRTFVWPFVIEEIRQRPLMGYGREAMIRTGLGVRIWREFGEAFAHPHNAYLQWTHDNGFLGLIPILIFYFLVMRLATSIFLDKNSPACRAVGGMTLALVGALLIAGVGSQTFYPREGSLPMWCAMGLALRCYVQRRNWRQNGLARNVDTSVGRTQTA